MSEVDAPTPTNRLSDAETQGDCLQLVWGRQSVWSQKANSLSAQVTSWRSRSLQLTIVGAVLATLSIQVARLSPSVGKGVAWVAAATVILAPVTQRKYNEQAVRDWSRARLAAETLKAEVFLYLARAGGYAGSDRDRLLLDRREVIEHDVDDLMHAVAGVQPDVRGLPAVCDVDSYVKLRVEQQIEGFYEPRSRVLRRRLFRVRAAEFSLAGVAAVVAALSTTFELEGLTVWVPVATTLAAAATAHRAAGRYEFLLAQYAGAAAELRRRVERRRLLALTASPEADDEFVLGCEHAIATQNEGWTA